MLSEEQTKEVKEQIKKQIDSWQASDEQKQQAVNQIESMTNQELEEFLAKNQAAVKTPDKGECVFCLIVNNKSSSYKIDENSKALAILEINPLSKGHALILSKNHSKLSSSAFSLANKLSRRIKARLKPEEVKIETSPILNHQIITVLPLYKNEKLERKKAEEKELILLQDKLKAKPRIKKQKAKESEQVLEKAPKRFP